MAVPIAARDVAAVVGALLVLTAPVSVVGTLIVKYDTIPGQAPTFSTLRLAPICHGGYGLGQILGDTQTNCTVHNNRLDEEDIDADNVLNLTTAERDQEQWQLTNLVGTEGPGGGASGQNLRMAASNLPPALLQAVNEHISGEPLNAAAEATARNSGWH